MNPFISIFMPVYNGQAFIEHSIASIRNQTFQNWELVCVDDSSTDESFAILQCYAEKDSRIRVFRKKNGGTVPVAWNYVRPLLRGDFILYMSQDDFLSEDMLEKCYKRQQETNADIITADMIWYTGPECTIPLRAGVNGNRDVILTGREAFELDLDWEIANTSIYHRDLIMRVEFDEANYNSDDLAGRMLYFYASKVAFCSGVFYYRQNNQSAITKKYTALKITGLRTTLRLLELKEKYSPSKVPAQILNLYYSWCTNYYLYVLYCRKLTAQERLLVQNVLYEIFTELVARKSHTLVPKYSRWVIYITLRHIAFLKIFSLGYGGYRLLKSRDRQKRFIKSIMGR